MPYDSQGRYYEGLASGADTSYGSFASSVQGPTYIPAGGSVSTTDRMAEYNADQEARYNEILAGYDQQIAAAAAQTTQAGLDVAANYQGFGSQIQQNLMSRGLANTSIAPTMQLGVQREHESAQNRLRDQWLRQQADLQGGRLGFMAEDMWRTKPPTGGGYGALFSGGGGGGGRAENANPASVKGRAEGAGYSFGGLTMPYRSPLSDNYTGYSGYAGDNGIVSRGTTNVAPVKAKSAYDLLTGGAFPQRP